MAETALRNLTGGTLLCALINCRYHNEELVENLIATRELKEIIDDLKKDGVQVIGEVR